MMLTKIADSLFKIRSVVGMEIILLPDEQVEYNYVQLSRKGKLIVTESNGLGIGNLRQVQEVIDNNVPIWLSLSGRGILHKKIKQASGDVKHSLLSIFPNVKPDDFYIQRYVVGQDIIFSIVRKKTLDEILNFFKQNKLAVIGVCLGPFSVDKLFPVMELESDNLLIGSHLIRFENNHIIEYNFLSQKYQDRSFKVDSEYMPEAMLVAYSVSLQALAIKNTISLDVEELIRSKDELINKKVFEVLGVTALLIFFVALLANFILFNYYNHRYVELSSNYSEYSTFKTDFDSINKEIERKETFLLEADWMRPSQISLYADRIGESVPSSIVLKEMSVNPLDNGLTRTQKKHVFLFNRIILSGICNRPTDLNSWIQSIKIMNWVSEVEIRNYTYDDKIHRGIFLIEIIVK